MCSGSSSAQSPCAVQAIGSTRSRGRLPWWVLGGAVMSVPSWEGEQGWVVCAGAGVAVDVVVEVGGEDVECAGGEPGGAVGGGAGAASGYYPESAVQALEFGGDRGESERAGSALYGGCGGEVAQQVRGLGESAGRVGQGQQDSDPEGGSGAG